MDKATTIEPGDRVRYVGGSARWHNLEGKVSGIWESKWIDVDFDNGLYATHVDPEHLEKIMTKPAIIPGPGASRDIVGAARAAVKQGHSTCTIMLTNGTKHEFGIHEVLDDSLLGQRLIAPSNKVTLVMFSAIAMIEFGG